LGRGLATQRELLGRRRRLVSRGCGGGHVGFLAVGGA
jgi:hypothetical protein